MHAALLLALLCVITFVAGQSWETGRATYYGDNGGGACGYDIADPSANFGVEQGMTFAIMWPAWDNSASCGQCFEVKGAKGTITVLNNNLCPDHGWCDGVGAFHMDLNQAAFSRIDDLTKGVIPTQIRKVPCPVSGPVKLFVKEGSSIWWLGLRPFNHRYPIKSLELKENGGQFVTTQLQNAGHFYLYTSSGAKLPITVRLTDIHGQQQLITINSIVSSGIISGNGNFPVVGAVSTPTTTTTSKAPSTTKSVTTTKAPTTTSPQHVVKVDPNWNPWWIQITITPNTGITSVSATYVDKNKIKRTTVLNAAPKEWNSPIYSAGAAGEIPNGTAVTISVTSSGVVKSYIIYAGTSGASVLSTHLRHKYVRSRIFRA